MTEIFVNYKPKLWCLMLHQVYWVYRDDAPDINYCQACKQHFFYPTKKHHDPIYRREAS